jgi:RNA polymerase sigma-70 factor (ECF subfamily)
MRRAESLRAADNSDSAGFPADQCNRTDGLAFFWWIEMDGAEQATLRAAAAGDAQAWRKLVEAYSGRVYGLIYRQCRDAELSEEITQATFVKVVKKLRDYEDEGRFAAWVFRIASNQLRDEMRRRRRQARPTDFTETPPQALGIVGDSSGDDPAAPLIAAESADLLGRAVEQLPEADRQVLNLRYTARLGFAEIAESLGQPLGTVLARHHRALRKLKDRLGATVGEQP